MQIEGFNTCKCGNDNFLLRKEGMQYGIYCQKCGKWLKWANKNERTLFEEENSEQNLQALREMLEDVNPEEIASHIADNTLGVWCETWRSTALMYSRRIKV